MKLNTFFWSSSPSAMTLTVRRIACLLCHRTFENIHKTARAPCWQRVSWLTFSAGGRVCGINPRDRLRHLRSRRAGHQARDLRRYQFPARRRLRQEDQICRADYSGEGTALALLLRDPAVGPLSGSALHQGAVLRHGRRRPCQGHAEAGADPRGHLDADRRADAVSGAAAAASGHHPEPHEQPSLGRPVGSLVLPHPLSGQPRKPILADLCAARWPSLHRFARWPFGGIGWRLRSE